ncbi:response regulator [bacterium]|nr:response regulator [bacterium]
MINLFPQSNQPCLRQVKASKRILVVDDEEDIVKMIAYQLRAEGYQVKGAADGLEALEKVAEFTPDLIVLDIMMPKVDGWVVCHSVKGHVNTKNTRVIILSAKTQFTAKIKGLYILQADLYMTKPFELEDLSQNISNLLSIEAEATLIHAAEKIAS